MTLEEKAEEHHPSKKYRAVVLIAFLAFACLTFLAYRSVEVAHAGTKAAEREAEAAKNESEEAAAKVEQLQRTQDCAIRVTTNVVSGLLQNSIVQNDVLLVSAEAGDRAAVIQSLKETRAHLVSIANDVHKANEECTK